MPRQTRRRHQQGEASRQRILEATLAIAAERGYEGTSVAAVTEATGLPASSIYWHFGSKDQLLADTLEYSFREWRRASPTWAREVEPLGLRSQIRSRLHRAAQAISQSPEFWRLGLMLALEHRVEEPAARRRFLEVRVETQQAIEQWWQKILPSDVSTDAELVARLARFHLAVMDGLYVGIRADQEWQVEPLVDLVADGLHAHVVQRRQVSA